MPKKKVKKITFEEKYEVVEENLSKRRGKWFLKAISWISWDDVCQIIRSHIYNKWSQWDQSRPLEPWLNRIISNQIKNILRNNYGHYIRPCVKCPFNVSGSVDNIHEENFCSWTKSGKQDGSCPLFSKWEKSKKALYDINMAINIESHSSYEKSDKIFDIDSAQKKLNKKMKEILSEKHYTIYEMLYIKNLDTVKTAEKLGYKSNEKGRRAGYKQIKNFEKMFRELAKKIIQESDIV